MRSWCRILIFCTIYFLSYLLSLLVFSALFFCFHSFFYFSLLLPLFCYSFLYLLSSSWGDIIWGWVVSSFWVTLGSLSSFLSSCFESNWFSTLNRHCYWSTEVIVFYWFSFLFWLVNSDWSLARLLSCPGITASLLSPSFISSTFLCFSLSS